MNREGEEGPRTSRHSYPSFLALAFPRAIPLAVRKMYALEIELAITTGLDWIML